MNRKQLSALFFIAGLACMVVAVLLPTTLTTTAQEDEQPDPLGEPGTFLTEYYEAWVNSPHARFEDDAFRHWDEDGEISERCAACHSTTGFLDFVGADGSEAGVVDVPAALGTVVNCDACHNSVTEVMTEITFPSGATIGDLDDSSRCMICHQGRSSGLRVASDIEAVGLMDEPNTVSEELGFINIHYYAAASTIYGSEVTGGYEYPGKSYHMRNEHVEGYDTCAGCHDPHTLELDFATCTDCHEGAGDIDGVRAIRSLASSVDYDGDGDVEEGIAGEIETLQEMLWATIQTYATEVVGTSIGYGDGYPYMFIDTDGDGVISEEEGVRDNAYNSFTPALVRATYNYQVTQKDTGGYAHNPDYHIQLLYDSIEELNLQLEAASITDLSQARRDSFGHFYSGSDAFRHWDEDGEVSSRCSTCHTSEGLPFLLEHGVTIAFEPSNSLTCATCHNNFTEYTLYEVPEVEFPSGVVLGFGEDSANNICLQCHQGRESGLSVSSRISSAGVGDDEVSEALRFLNPHYFATGASLFGTEAQGAYEFEGMEYNGYFEHTRRFNECSDCHMPHAATIRFEQCIDCHEEVETLDDVALIRAHPDDKDRVDYDGDGDMDEPIAMELVTMEEVLFTLIQDYATNTIGMPIAYDANAYPYYFNDLNGDGVADPDEANYGNGYASWTPTLLRAVYNYQFVTKGAGGYAHNPDYLIQVLYDTIASVGGEDAVATYTRPEVRNDE